MVTYNYSNTTMFAIKNEALRHTWTGWYILVILSSLLGDTTILYSSLRHKVFKLHVVIVTIIQQISVIYLVLCVLWVLPNAVSTSMGGKGWDLGMPLSYIRVFVCYYCYPAGTLMICALTTTKLLILKYPLRATTWSKKHAYRVCLAIWLLSFYLPVTFLIVDKDDLFYDARVFTYDYGFSSDKWHFLAPISSLIFLLTPNIVIIVATVILIIKAAKIARDCQRSVSLQGVTMVIVSAVVYTLSVIPMTIYSIVEPLLVKDPIRPDPFHAYFYGIGLTVAPNLNLMGNFLNYFVTVKGFRVFVISTIKKWAPCFKKHRGQEGNFGKLDCYQMKTPSTAFYSRFIL